MPQKGVLVYVGLHRGVAFNLIFGQYEVCYGFEANPDLYKQLTRKFNRYPNVHIFNVAVADYDGEIKLNISHNEESSSIGNFSKDWDSHTSGKVEMIKTITLTKKRLEILPVR